MSDVEDLGLLPSREPTERELAAILSQIDLDVANLLRDGKLATSKYTAPGGISMDRAASLQALLAARKHYETLLANRPAWVMSQSECEPAANRATGEVS